MIVRTLARDRWLLTAVGLAAAADSVTTWIGLHGHASESNGPARAAIDALGLGPVLMLRVLVPVVFFFGLLALTGAVDRVVHRVAVVTITIVTVAWLGVALYNTTLIA